MPARVVAQDEIIRQRFQEQVRAKVEQEHRTKMERMDAALPSFLSGILKPMAAAFDSYDRTTSNIKGGIGETEVALKLRLLLSDRWVLMNNVVLEPEPGTLTQIDHIAIGPLGMYVIETKAWAGAFKGYRDRWGRKEGKGWVDCESPTKQNAYHVKAIRKWFDATESVGLADGNWIFPVVIFTRAEWLRARQCSVPVMDSVLGFVGYISNQDGGALLSPQQVEHLVQKLISPTPRPEQRQERSNMPVEKPLARPVLPTSNIVAGPAVARTPMAVARQLEEPTPALPSFEEKQTKAGRKYIRIAGSQKDAVWVREHILARGGKANEVQKDKFNQGTWYFYLD